MRDSDANAPLERRDLLKAAGAATMTIASFAGCAANSDDQKSDNTATAVGENLVELNGFSVPDENIVANGDISDDQKIPTLSLIVNPPKSTPNDHETSKAVSEEVSKLGLGVNVETMTWPAQSSTVWDGTDWDMTFWEMSGRPSRLDPDEFLVQMFHSDFQDGYNYYFWEDDEYDKLVMQQREERDEAERKKLVKQCQQIIHERGPSTFIMYPEYVRAWNSAHWDGVVDLSGMGASNMLTYSQINPKQGKNELTIAFNEELQAIQPFDQSGEVDMIQHRMLWDRLAWPDENAQPTPRLATEFNWTDDTTLEVPIRKGHTFHDGKPVTAEDVKFSYNVHKDYSTYFSGPVKPVSSIDVVDDHTVRFNFEYHFAPFPMAAMGRIAIVPKHKWTDIIENKMQVDSPMLYQEDEPLGSGPLSFAHWRKSEEVRLEKNADHFDPVNYDARNTRIVSSTQTMVTQLENGTVDMLAAYPGDKNVLKDKVENADNLSMTATTSVGFKQISYNNDRPPFHLDSFRRAINHRFPKETIVNEIYDGWGSLPPNTPTSSALEDWHEGSVEPYVFDLQAAANELVKAGFVWDEQNKKLHMPSDKTAVPEDQRRNE